MKRIVVLLAALVVSTVVLAPAAYAAYPGANGDIVFARDGDPWLLDPGTGDLTRLGRTRAREGLLDWNADGTQLAYTRCTGGEFGNCDIWVMDADGSNRTRLTTTPVAQETWPTWSPDGLQIAFTSNELDQFQDIWVMDANGANPPTRLTVNTDIFDAFPEWSPDGAQIAYTSDSLDVDDIWLMDADGQNPVRITTGPKVDERPDWSPDGLQLVFSRNGRDIWRVDADGTDLVQLTDNRKLETAPAFSPNGKRIVYMRVSHGRFGVWTMLADGTKPTRRTTGIFDSFPDWQPA